MTTPTAKAPATPAGQIPADLRRRHLPLRRRIVDQVVRALLILSVLVAVVPLGLVIWEVIKRGGSAMSLNFLTEIIPGNYRRFGPGMGPAVVGTLLITGMAALMAIPLGVLGAIYLNEYGGQSRLARTIRTMSDVMTGVPSIVMGLFILIVFVVPTGQQTGFAGSLALAALILPVVIRSTEEMLKLVPDELRQASAALGARKWRTILTVVLPAASSGITSGAMLAIARAAGETAPVVVTIGLFLKYNPNLFEGSNTTLAVQIFRNAAQPFAAAQERAWGAALTLMAIVVIFTTIARLLAGRFAIKSH